MPLKKVFLRPPKLVWIETLWLSTITAVKGCHVISCSTLHTSGKEKAHKHKQIFPVPARAGGGSPDRVGGGSPDRWPGVKKFMCCVRNPRNINVFVRVPGREESGSRPGGSVTGVTEKLFMCQMFVCFFRLLIHKICRIAMNVTYCQ